MLTILNPDTIAPPASTYSHAIEIPPNARWLYISGQVGVMPDGTMAEGPEAQLEWTWRNLVAILEAADMTVRDLVRINGYLLDAAYVPIFRESRVPFLGDWRPCATVSVVPRLASPDWLVEIEAVAAKAAD